MPDTVPSYHHYNKFKRFSWLLIGASISAGCLSLLVPLPPQNIPGSLQTSLFFSVAIAVLHFGIPYLFSLGLTKFTPLLRRAYALICIGIVLLGAAYLQFPIVSILNAWDSFWVRGGILPLPFFLAVIFLIVGSQRFARLLNITHLFTRLWLVFMVSLLVSVAIAFLPPMNVEPSLTFALTLGLMGWVTSISFMVTVLILKIKQSVSPRYYRAMQWFFWAFASECFAAFHYLAMLVILPEEHWYEPLGLVPVFIAALVMVRAGYVFNQIGSADHATAETQTTASSPVDVVVYLASLASSPTEIDVLLDDMRVVTARANQKNPAILSEEDQLKLAGVFNDIKGYLISNEKLRLYTAQELNEIFNTRYDSNSTSKGNAVFWKNVNL